MPGLTEHASVGDWLYVYNHGRVWPDKPDGAYLWRSQVLKVVRADPDPQTRVYLMWGPGGEESSPWPGRCLQRGHSGEPLGSPRAADPLDEVLTEARLNVVLTDAVSQMVVPTGPLSIYISAATTEAVRSLRRAWEHQIRAGTPPTARGVSADLRRVGTLLLRLADANEPL